MGASWFSHDSNARNSKKLIRLRQKHGAAGYGVYWMLVERLRDEDCYVSDRDYEMISFDLRVDVELIRSVVEDFGLFELSPDGKYFHAPGLDERMELKDVRSAAGKKGAANRWGRNPNGMAPDGKTMANAMANEDFANSIKEKESKDKDSKEDKIINTSSSFSSLSTDAVEEKEQEKILSTFFFKNWATPEKEMERFLAYNNTGGRCWAMMTQTERDSALTLWKQEPEQPKRLSATFLACWQKIFHEMQAKGAPHKLLMLALSDNIRYTESNSTGIVSCPRPVYMFIGEMGEAKDALRQGLIAGRGLTELKYTPCPT